jgi:hypothetical protein
MPRIFSHKCRINVRFNELTVKNSIEAHESCEYIRSIDLQQIRSFSFLFRESISKDLSDVVTKNVHSTSHEYIFILIPTAISYVKSYLVQFVSLI